MIRDRGLELEFSLENCRLRGVHNYENIMAALLAARALDADPEALQRAIDSFAGLPHRMQHVASVRGVAYVDDSKGTNVGAMIKSLAGFPDRRVVLIAGGIGKGGDYAQARALLASKARHIVVYGRARFEIEDAWRGVAPIEVEPHFAEAVRCASRAASAGDIVLLSPACASMDQFISYAHRGDAFVKLVREL